jgi:hypothetical protein
MRRVGLLLLLAHGSVAQVHPDRCLKEYSAEEVVSAVRRKHVCTLLLLAAKWDGHYKQFASDGAWQALSQAACEDDSIEVGVYHYSGAGAGEPGSIPTELGVGATIGGYTPHVWLSGKDFGELKTIRGASAQRLRAEHGNDWPEKEAFHVCREVHKLQELENKLMGMKKEL